MRANKAMPKRQLTLVDFFKSSSLSFGLILVFLTLSELTPNLKETYSAWHTSVGFAVSYLAFILLIYFPVWWLVIYKKKLSWSDFGFKKIKILKLLGWVLGAYLLMFLFFYGLQTLVTSLGLEIPGFQEQDSYIPIFGEDLWGLLLGGLFALVIAPIFEEFMFRSYIYQCFKSAWPRWLASLSAASLFSLIHLQLEVFFPLLIIGLILNELFERSGSIWTSITFHTLNNAVAFGAQLLFYFHPDFFLESQAHLENWVHFLV